MVAAMAVTLRVAIGRGAIAPILSTALLLAACGFLAAKVRVNTVHAPVLEKQMTNATLTGVVERVEPKVPRGERLTIRVETLGDLPEHARPHRVRVRTLKARPQGVVPLRAGDRVSLTATLSPPARPAMPGDFDFARAAYFERLGGVGYTFRQIDLLPAAQDAGWRARYTAAIEDLRARINARIKTALPGETGAIAAALVTGERGGISEATNESYRGAGLFHILSISGLHMVIMAGAVFFSVRLVLAAIPAIALTQPIKKWAALAGIAGALAYLAISGGAFATVRSAIQIVVMFLAILMDRPALALRNVALAAFLILLVFPESLFDPGFQMSFAAVTGLIATYEAVRQRYTNRFEPHPLLHIAMFFGGIVLSTVVASIAVAPFAAYHFHQSQQYAVLANLIAIPVCNFVVMPAALAALILMPFGLEVLPLAVMGKGIEAMTWCATLVAGLPGAVGRIPAIPASSFALLVLGGLWLALWQARWRLFGIAMALAGVLLAPFMPRPDILVARGGELVAVRAQDGVLSALPARQSKFELSRWLESDGDGRDVREAAKAGAFRCDGIGCTARVKGVLLAVARHPAAIADDCATAELLVMTMPRLARGCAAPKRVIDFFDVWREGTHALYIEPGKTEQSIPNMRVETVAAWRGDRPWSRRSVRRPAMAAKTDATPAARPSADRSRAKRSGSSFFDRQTQARPPLPPRPEIEDDTGEDAVDDDVPGKDDTAAKGEGYEPLADP